MSLSANAEAGADVLFAPGPQNASEIKALVEAVAPKPLNLLVVRDIGLRLDDIAALGVRRIGAAVRWHLRRGPALSGPHGR